jgi:hypothetical protein
MRALQISMRTACLPCLPCLHPHMHPGAGDVHDSASSRGVPPSLRGEEAAEGWEVYCRFRRREEVACALDCRHALLSSPIRRRAQRSVGALDSGSREVMCAWS